MPPRSRLCAQGRCKAVRPFWVPNGQPCWTLVPWPGLSSAKATSGHSPPPLLLQLSHQPGYKWLRRPRVFSLRYFLFYYSFPLAVLGLHRCTGFSPVAGGWGSSLVSPASQCSGLSCCRTLALKAKGLLELAPELRACSSRALEHRLNSVAHGLSCRKACGIFPGQGSNPCLLHWQANDSLLLSPQGSPCNAFLKGKGVRAWFSARESLAYVAPIPYPS